MGQSRNHLSKEAWIVLRELYESGRYGSLEAVCDVVSGALGCKMPTLKSIYARCERDGWVKGVNSDAIKQKVEKRIVDMFVDQGMPVERMVAICIEGLIEHESISKEVSDALKKDLAGDGVSKYTEDLVKKFIDSKNTRLKYLQEANKMAGNYDRDREDNPVVVQFDSAATEALLRRRAARADR
jgi:hypothetical protein